MDRVPVFRLLGGPDHFYTIGEQERDDAIAKYGYRYECVAFYVSSTPDADPPPDPAPMSVRDQLAVAVIGHLVAEAARATRQSKVTEAGTVQVLSDYAAKMSEQLAAAAYRYADAMLKVRGA